MLADGGGHWSPWLWWTYPECQLYAFRVEMKTTGHLVVRVGSLLKLSSVTLERGGGGRREGREIEREKERGGERERGREREMVSLIDTWYALPYVLIIMQHSTQKLTLSRSSTLLLSPLRIVSGSPSLWLYIIH